MDTRVENYFAKQAERTDDKRFSEIMSSYNGFKVLRLTIGGKVQKTQCFFILSETLARTYTMHTIPKRLNKLTVKLCYIS